MGYEKIENLEFTHKGEEYKVENIDVYPGEPCVKYYSDGTGSPGSEPEIEYDKAYIGVIDSEDWKEINESQEPNGFYQKIFEEAPSQICSLLFSIITSKAPDSLASSLPNRLLRLLVDLIFGLIASGAFLRV